jgi:hypothetical protein
MSAGRHLGNSLALKIALGLAQKQLMDTHRYETARPVPDEVFDRLRITLTTTCAYDVRPPWPNKRRSFVILRKDDR